MKIGIDLLWVRVGKCGGTESFIRNLIEGFAQFDKENQYILLTSRDNQESFRRYCNNRNIMMHVCPVESEKRVSRVLWESTFMDKWVGHLKIDIMFIPVYSMPKLRGSGIPYITQIHDLQAFHYPEYFTVTKRLFFKRKWEYACRNANEIVTISNYCKEDLIKHYPYAKDRINVIYIPIVKQVSNVVFEDLQKRFRIEKEQYFYCVSSLLPHKNLHTILAVMQERKKHNMVKDKLVISGVGGNEKKLIKEVQRLGIQDLVVNTGFVEDEVRDCLYENCKLLLFPSIFEGFGMPAIEAMQRGKAVVTTDKSCLLEITQGKAVYVKNPTDVGEWMNKIRIAQNKKVDIEEFDKYDLETIVHQYLEIFRRNLI